MKINTSSEFEKIIYDELKKIDMSVSHDEWHLNRVLQYSKLLQSIYGGDEIVIRAAVIMHDLGRSDSTLHGQESIDASINIAKIILGKINISEEIKEKILLAIYEHDKPEIRPSTIEGKILKDSDFLAGFGAWGILRIAMWAGETNSKVDLVKQRLENKMRIRMKNLEFIESQNIAQREFLFVNLFNKSIYQAPKFDNESFTGKYIILEGISGAGKDTQAKIISDCLLKKGFETLIVREPAEEYKRFRKIWEERNKKRLDDPEIMRYLLLADRYELINNKVKPALISGKTVISIRSFLSTLVYQCTDEKDDMGLDIAKTAYLHSFVPKPDLIIYLDVDEKIAWERIKTRKKRGVFENPEMMQIHRQRYKNILASTLFSNNIIQINANESLRKVTLEIYTWIEKILSNERKID